MQKAKYTQIYETLKQDIAAGKYASCAQFPSEALLTKRFQVARETLRKALSKLEKEHLIHRRQGCQSWVRYLPSQQRKILYTAPECRKLPVSFQQAATAAGVEASFLSLGQFRNFTLHEMDDFLLTEGISGIVVSGSHFYSNEDIFENLSQQNIPLVLVFASLNDFSFNELNGIYYDICAGWRKALSYLAQCGYRRVGTLAPEHGGRIRDFPVFQYTGMLQELGLSTDSGLLFGKKCISNSREMNHPCRYAQVIVEEVLRMLKLPEPADAFLCFNDQWAPFVYQAVRQAGKRIPQDVAVMGFISSFDCESLEPPLSSIEVEYQEVFAQAIDWLLHPPSTRQVVPMKQNLKIRGSTARFSS